MNNTNRALNRVVLFLIGLLFLVIGAGTVAVIVWPAAAEWWIRAGTASGAWIERSVAATTSGSTTLSGFALAALALILLLVVLLIVALVRTIGGRRSHLVFRSNGQENSLGRLTIEEGFVSDALKHSLGQRDEILLSNVTANNIREQAVMHVSVTPRQNTSPLRIAEDVDQLVRNLATMTGRDVPTFISIHSGFRAKLAHDQRRIT